MRRITMRVLHATPTRIVEVGQTAEFDDDEADYLVDAKMASPADVEAAEPNPADESDVDTGPSLPPRSATKKDWVAFATSPDGGEMDADTAKKMTRTELADLYHEA